MFNLSLMAGKYANTIYGFEGTMGHQRNFLDEIIPPVQSTGCNVPLEYVTIVPVYRDTNSGDVTLTPSGPLLGIESEISDTLSVSVFLYDTPAQAKAAAKTALAFGATDGCELQKLRSGEAALLFHRSNKEGGGVVLSDLRCPDPGLFQATLSLHWKRSDVVRFFDCEMDRCIDPYSRGKRLARILGGAINDPATLSSCQKSIESFPGARIAIKAISSERIFEEIEDRILMMEDDEDDSIDPPSIFSIHHHLRCIISEGSADGLTCDEVVDMVIARACYRKKYFA